jgi:hypothetical protein
LILPRIVAGLKALGISPDRSAGPPGTASRPATLKKQPAATSPTASCGCSDNSEGATAAGENHKFISDVPNGPRAHKPEGRPRRSLLPNEHTPESDALTLPFYLQAWINSKRADSELESTVRTTSDYLGIRFELLIAVLLDSGDLSDKSVLNHLSPRLIRFFDLGTVLGQAYQTAKFHKAIEDAGASWQSMLSVARLRAVTLVRGLMPDNVANLEGAFDFPKPEDCERSLLEWIDGALFTLIAGGPGHGGAAEGYAGSPPHALANPDRAARLNREYQEARAAYLKLPFWKRWLTKHPEPPSGI